MIAAAGAVVAIGGGVGGYALASNTASSTLHVHFSSSSDGSAGFDAAGDIVLTTGAAVSTTFAEADPISVEGKPAPASEPTFVTNHYAAGSPRWVIELSNGNSLWGYPPNAGLNGSDFAWAVNNGNSYVSYAAAYAGAGAGDVGVTVTAAGIVMDGDQPSATDIISGATWDGRTLAPNHGHS